MLRLHRVQLVGAPRCTPEHRRQVLNPRVDLVLVAARPAQPVHVVVRVRESVSLLKLVVDFCVRVAQVTRLKSILCGSVTKEKMARQTNLHVCQGSVVLLVFSVLLSHEKAASVTVWQKWGEVTYEDLLLGGNLLALVHGVHSAVDSEFSLILADTGLTLANDLSVVLAEAVLDVVADQHSCSVLVLRVSDFGVERHFSCFNLIILKTFT